MTLKFDHVFGGGGAQALPFTLRQPRSDLLFKSRETSPGSAIEPATGDEPTARRRRIWEFGTNLHCSIIGTCLSTGELRHTLEKLKVDGVVGASDHDVHCLGVMLAGRREGGAKLLQKALDRHHRGAINRYGKLKEPAELLELWEESLKQGDIPGAYWAALTHPAATEATVKRAFTDVHMLSHLVGAANRADIRRLRQLELDNAALTAKVQRQQRHLNDGFSARDRTIFELNQLVARQAAQFSERHIAQRYEQDSSVDSVVGDLNCRLVRETSRVEACERRIEELSKELQAKQRELQTSQQEYRSIRDELETIEQDLGAASSNCAPEIQLPGKTFLYIGGRAHQVPRLRQLVERAGAQFLHHDGGIEHSRATIPGLLSCADRALFPVDCISHEAVTVIKRLCRLHGKPYDPLRTASLTCLMAALARLSTNASSVTSTGDMAS